MLETILAASWRIRPRALLQQMLTSEGLRILPVCVFVCVCLLTLNLMHEWSYHRVWMTFVGPFQILWLDGSHHTDTQSHVSTGQRTSAWIHPVDKDRTLSSLS